MSFWLQPGVSILFLLKIQGDTRAWLRTAYEHVPGSGPLQRLRIIYNRTADQTGYAGMTDSRPARKSDGNIARFREFKQAREFRIPCGGDAATRECDWGARSWRPWRQMRSMNYVRHPWGNSFEGTENFRVHIRGEYAPILQPLAHTLQK